MTNTEVRTPNPETQYSDPEDLYTVYPVSSIVLLLSFHLLLFRSCPQDLRTPVPLTLIVLFMLRSPVPRSYCLARVPSCSYLAMFLPFRLVSYLAETIKSLCHVTILQFVYRNRLALFHTT